MTPLLRRLPLLLGCLALAGCATVDYGPEPPPAEIIRESRASAPTPAPATPASAAAPAPSVPAAVEQPATGETPIPLMDKPAEERLAIAEQYRRFLEDPNTIKLPNGSVYQGEMDRGKFHGFGVI